MKKELFDHIAFFVSYFLFIVVSNGFYSLSYWPLYVGGVVGLFLAYSDHLLHVFVFNTQELTSQRAMLFLKNRQFKEIIVLLHDTWDERKNLIFHTVLFQIIFAVLTFWVVSSSANLFARGLVLGYFLSLVIYNLKKYLKKELILNDIDSSRIYFISQVLALFIFGFLL